MDGSSSTGLTASLPSRRSGLVCILKEVVEDAGADTGNEVETEKADADGEKAADDSEKSQDDGSDE
jgi:hypothetical protein